MNSRSSEEVKAACKEYRIRLTARATNGTATETAEAIKDADCDVCRDIVKNKDFTRLEISGSSVRDGWKLTISDSAA